MSRAPDPRIDSDAKRPDPDVSVPGWLDGRPAYRDKVAAVGSRDVYPFILDVARGGLPVNAGRMPIAGGSLNDREASLDRPIARSPRVRADRRDDAVTFPVALGRLRRDAPRPLPRPGRHRRARPRRPPRPPSPRRARRRRGPGAARGASCKWMNLPRERERLFKTIGETEAEGAILLGGDRHQAELSMMDGGVGYPIYDLTSSGLNRASGSWRPFEANRHRVAAMNRGDNFGPVATGRDRPDPVIGPEIRDVEGDVTIRRKIHPGTIRRLGQKPARRITAGLKPVGSTVG